MFKKLVLRLSTILIAAIATSLILSAGTSFAADRYWVGSGGNTSDTANWSTLSAGGGGASVPSTSDIAYFDSGGGDATVNAALSVSSLQLLGTYTGTITGGSDTLTTSSTLIIAGGTYTAGTGAITIGNTTTISGTGTFDASSTTLLTINGSLDMTSGATNLIAPSATMRLKGFVYLTSGTFDANGGTVELFGFSKTLDVNATETFYNLKVNKNAGYVLTIANDDVITVENLLTLTEGFLNTTGTARIDSEDSATAGDADVSIASTFDGGTGDIHFLGTTDFSIPGGAVLPKVTINNSALTVLTTGSGTVSFNTLTITDGDFDNDGNVNITVSGAYIQDTGSFLPGDGTVLNFSSMDIGGGTFDVGLDTPTSLTTSSTVTVSGTATLDISTIPTVTVGGIFLIEDTGTFDASGVTTLTLNNSLDMSSGATTFTAPSGTMRVKSFVYLTSGAFDANGGTVELIGFSKTLNTSATNTFYNLEINKNTLYALTLNSSVEVDGDLLISSGTFSAGSYEITLAGDFTNNYGFAQGTSTVTLDGTDQTIGGSTNTTFYNLSKDVTSADTLSFANGSITEVTGTTTLTGTSGNQLTLNSDLEGTQWSLNAALAGRTINYVSVQDSNNASGTDIDLTDGGAGEYGINLGNNLNWTLFDPPPAPAVPEFTTWLYIIGMMLTGGYFYRGRIFEAVQYS